MPSVEAPRRLEAAVEAALAVFAVGRPGTESGAPVGTERHRPEAALAGATPCTAGVTPSAGRAADSAARRSRDTTQRPPQSQALQPKPVTPTHNILHSQFAGYSNVHVNSHQRIHILV